MSECITGLLIHAAASTAGVDTVQLAQTPDSLLVLPMDRWPLFESVAAKQSRVGVSARG